MLDQLDAWIDDIPLDTGMQRFGNKAFRKWGERLEEVFVLLQIALHVLTAASRDQKAYTKNGCRKAIVHFYLSFYTISTTPSAIGLA